jgi:hypothetical protein
MPVKSGRALWVDEEMGERAIARHMIRLGGHNDNLKIFSCQGFTLGTEEGLAILEREIGDFKPLVVFFDSMTHAMRGIENENDARQVAEVFGRIHYLREKYETAFVFIDHSPKWGRFGQPTGPQTLDLILRGSSVKQTQATGVFAVLPRNESSLILRQVKRRESDHLLSVIVGYSIDENNRITLTNEGTPEDALGAEERAAEWILDHVGERGTARRAEIVEAGVTAGHARRTLQRAVDAQFHAGRLEKPGRGVYRVALLGANLVQRGANDELF